MTEDKPEIEITEKQKRFCENYFKDFNGSRAYKEVYGNVTDESARALSSKLLTNINVKCYLDSLKKRLAELSGISPIKILREYEKIAFSSISHLHNTWIERKNFELLTDEQKDCIQEIETKTRVIFDKSEKKPVEVEYVKVKLYDKLKSLDSINKMLGYNAPEEIDLSSLGEKIEFFILPASKKDDKT